MRTKITTLAGFNQNVKVNFKQLYFDPLIKLKKYSDSYTLLGAGLTKNGFPSTGLTEDYAEPKEGNKIPKKVQGTRKAMERLLDLEEGTLKNTSKFWASFQIRIGAEPLEWDLTDPQDLLKYLFALDQSIVCDGISNVHNSSKYEFVLYSEDQEAERRIKDRSALKRAYQLAEELDLETKMNILNVYGIITDAANVNTIVDKLDECIERDPSIFLERANDGFLVVKSLVTKALDKAVLTMADGAIYHGEVVLGYDKQSAAENLAKNEVLQKILKAKMSGDMDIIKQALQGAES